MIFIKSDDEVELTRKSCLLVSKTHAMLAAEIAPGVTTSNLDKLAKEFILDNGGVPGFLNYNGFPNTLCVSVNDVVVHGIPSSLELKDGDIVSIDCGVLMNGFYGDSCYTFEVGEAEPTVRALLVCTKECLYKGIEQAVAGNRIGDIGCAVQKHAESHRYSVVEELVGHGVGRFLHEEPSIPNFGRAGKGLKLKERMIIAIEPVINMGKRAIVQERDGWTIRTKDGKPSAHFEHTVVVKNGKADILSDFSLIEEVLKKKKN